MLLKLRLCCRLCSDELLTVMSASVRPRQSVLLAKENIGSSMNSGFKGQSSILDNLMKSPTDYQLPSKDMSKKISMKNFLKDKRRLSQILRQSDPT